MKTKLEEIINLLPFDILLRKELIENFSKYSDSQRFALEQILWQTYDSFFQLRLEENVELALADLDDKGIVPEGDFYKKIYLKTKEEVHSQEVILGDEVALKGARESLEKILNENNTSS